MPENLVRLLANSIQIIKAGLESAGFTPEIQDLSYFQDDYGLGAGGDEIDSSDSDEDDGGEQEEDDIDDLGGEEGSEQGREDEEEG